MGAQGRKSAELVAELRAARRAGDVNALAAIAADQAAKPPLRMTAIKALAATGDARAVKPLAEVTTDAHAALRMEAIKAIGELGGDDGAPALIAALESGGGKASVAAASALAKRRDGAAVPALVGVLGSTSNWKLRKTVALALSRIGHEDGLRALRAAAEAESSRGKAKVLARYAEPSGPR